MNVEARTVADMAVRQIMPASMNYIRFRCESAAAKKQMGISTVAESDLVQKLNAALEALYARVEQLKAELKSIPNTSAEDAANYCHDVVISSMTVIRQQADILEELTAKEYWPYPTYSDLLFY